ncbi:MAG: hypothetical protein V3T02_04785 [Alphaproteobacteria bacterium]
MAKTDEYDFSQVSVVLFYSTLGMRRTLRDAFGNMKIRKIRDCRDLAVARDTVVNIKPDILFLDLDKNQDAVCTLIDDIRHSNVGANPFMVIMLVTWDSEELSIAEAMRAGADDIVSMPVSINVLKARIENMIRNRKQFIVTSQYVGPERREHERSRTSSGNDIGTIVVPNSLRHKAAGDTEAAVDAEVIEDANKLVNQHMLHRMMTELSQLATDLEAQVKGRDHIDIPDETLGHMSDLLSTITNHIDTKGYNNMKGLAESMNRVMNLILATPDPSAKMFQILKLHGQAIGATLWDKDGAADMVVNALKTAVENS